MRFSSSLFKGLRHFFVFILNSKFKELDIEFGLLGSSGILSGKNLLELFRTQTCVIKEEMSISQTTPHSQVFKSDDDRSSLFRGRLN